MTTKPSRGFTLLEILIALLILSVGLLGLAGLQVNGLRSNQDSYYLSQAMAQAYDMADRIRANRTGAGSYNGISGIPSSDPDCTSKSCSSADMETHDLFQWNTANKNLLPNGQGRVAVAGNSLIITVMWNQLRNKATGTGCGSDPTVDLTCFQTSFQP